MGGASRTIQVINRPQGSGTHQAFREMVLRGGNFGTTPNITTLPQDVSTPLLRALGTNGIGYATYAQVANQQTVRTVPVDGMTPEAANYPYQRILYYAYKQPASSQVQAFLGYVASRQAPSPKPQAPSSKPQAPSSKLQAPSSKLQAPSPKPQAPRTASPQPQALSALN